jgi:branched-subunit amino acid transport protein AzlD
MDNGYVLAAFLVMAAATFATRLFPFLIPRKHRDNPHLRFIGLNLPPAVMLLLVVYCLKDARWAAPTYGIPQAVSVAVVALAHLWKRNALVSIALGTASYVYLLPKL